MSVVAVDPGPTESAYVYIDDEYRPRAFGKWSNETIRGWLAGEISTLSPRPTFAIEMVASYGMAVGVEVFDTVFWAGRFVETLESRGITPELVYRRDVKLHHCGQARAKDANVVQALVDRFASGQPNLGKGTKAAPGWFYGFKADLWQAYALAVYVADMGAGL